MTKFLYRVVVVALVAAGFYSWRVEGVQGAANLLHFTACVFGFIGIVGSLMTKPGEIKSPPAGTTQRAFNWIADLGIVGAFAWVGDFGYAIIWLASTLAVFGAGQIGRRPAKVAA